jgi:hypothetical protein
MQTSAAESQIEREILNCLQRHGRKPAEKQVALNSSKLFKLLKEEREQRGQKEMSPTTFNKYMPILDAKGLVEKRVLSHKNVIYILNESKTVQWALDELFSSVADLFVFLHSHRTEGAVDDERWEASRDTASKLFGNMATAELPKIRAFLQVVVRAIDRYQNDQKYQKNGQP